MTGGTCGTRWAGPVGRDGWGMWDTTGRVHGTQRAGPVGCDGRGAMVGRVGRRCLFPTTCSLCMTARTVRMAKVAAARKVAAEHGSCWATWASSCHPGFHPAESPQRSFRRWLARRMGRDGWPLRKRPPNGQWPLTTPWRYHPSRWHCLSSASRLPSSSRAPEVVWVEIYTKPVCMSK